MDEPKIKLERPLFYKCPYGLRFEIGPSDKKIWNENNDTLNGEYFSIALQRAMSIFGAAFEPNDDIEIAYQIFSDGRRKIKRRSFIFKQVKSLDKANIEFSDHKDIYEENLDYKCEHWKRVTISNITAADIETEQLLKAAINTDFSSRTPHFIGECYLINITKQLVLILYDDRGMDVVSSNKDQLQALYKSHNKMILDYDRVKIDKVFL
jgi:hypothetical protein